MPPSSKDPTGDDLSRSEAELSWVRSNRLQAELASRVDAQVAQRARTVRRRYLGAAMCALLIAAAVAVFHPHRFNANAVADRGGGIEVAGKQRLTLPDGSTADLNDGAHLTVAFSGDGKGRRIVRLERGEAFFQVAKDPSRPFIVVVGSVGAQALGTAYDVRCGAGRVEVLVAHGTVGVGTVDLHAEAKALRPSAVVGAAHEVTVAPDGRVIEAVRPVPAPALHDRLAWRVPVLKLDNTPLATIVQQVNQYAEVRLQLADPALGEVRLGGILRADNVTVLTQMLARQYNIVAEESNGNLVLHQAAQTGE